MYTKIPPENFKLHGKVYKTCATCLIKKAEKRVDKKTAPNHNNIETIILNNLTEYVIELIDSFENNSGLSFTINVDVNMSDQNFNIKSIVNMVVNSIEEGDGYNWNFYKSDNNHVNSAYSFLKSDKATGCELCYELMTDQTTAIGFITSLYNKIKSISEIHCDATYKTAKGRFELYGLICNFKGIGYLLAYLILDTIKVSDKELQDERRTHALTEFFDSIRSKGLYPDYFFTDKDFSEINVAKRV
ncbi:4758_t:CDS:2 [Racocetra fulgida]|uniref:4758_t:CDS:1 n=1 Tax=Racocetra fulgida TaxID=60492 RepID=A0A9N9A4C9_9GLOM|nr:4758_t:CDS:2 [Racocetra fulgida]